MAPDGVRIVAFVGQAPASARDAGVGICLRGYEIRAPLKQTPKIISIWLQLAGYSLAPAC